MKSAVLGQHFLINKRTIERIVGVAEVNADDHVVEIGTGEGFLTEWLLKTGCEITSYEVDERLFQITKERFKGYSRLHLKLGDGFATKEDFDVVVSSLPYYASRRFVEWMATQHIPKGVVLLQKEFVDKMMSSPSTKKYGTYSVLSQHCFKMEELFLVPPDDFFPRPKVLSSVIRLSRVRSVLDGEGCARKLKILFSYRGRKISRFIKDASKKRGWKVCDALPNFFSDMRVEGMSPDQAMELVRCIGSG